MDIITFAGRWQLHPLLQYACCVFSFHKMHKKWLVLCCSLVLLFKFQGRCNQGRMVWSCSLLQLSGRMQVLIFVDCTCTTTIKHINTCQREIEGKTNLTCCYSFFIVFYTFSVYITYSTIVLFLPPSLHRTMHKCICQCPLFNLAPVTPSHFPSYAIQSPCPVFMLAPI